MITRIAGTVREKKDTSVVVDVGGISYEVLVPPAVMQKIDASRGPDVPVNLITYHYLQIEPSRGVPVLIGFLNEIEREFFEQFITVSGIGPKAACRALSTSFSAIADAIDRGDIAFLKTLPGIGERKAREIVAKLQGKVGKFGLIQDRSAGESPKVQEDIKEEALSVLLQLQYRRNEAKEMVERAAARNPGAATCEELLNEVYKGSKAKTQGRS